MYTVWCYQDLNGGSISGPNGGGDLVYVEIPTPNEDLLLGGGGSECLRKSGSAD